MNLDDVAVAIRPRNHWEAIDLGFRLARKHWRALYGAWACCLLTVAGLVHLLTPGSTLLALLLVWWLKPLMDRVLLIVLSRSVFGATPGLVQTLQSLPGALRHGALHALTLGRLDPGRSFTMPVWQLEGLRGRARRQRLTTLRRRTGSAALWHTVACWHLETAVFLSLALLALWMVPEQAMLDWDPILEAETMPLWMQIARNVVYVLAVLVVEPFYVAGGFCLYLNRRTLLEGWDIELEFRRLAPRVAAHTATREVA